MRVDLSFLPAYAAAFMLIFARIGTMVMLLPGLGEMSVPPRIRLTVALLLAAVLYPLHRAMFADASPAPAKYALSRLHDWFLPDTRLPIAPCSNAGKAAVDAALEGLGLV